MNNISVYGRVASDVQLNDANGQNVAKFRVAAQNGRKDANGEFGTNFYSVSVWGKSGENIAKYLKKGHRIVVCGDLVIRQYKGNDGNNYTSVEIDHARVDFVETRGEAEAKASAKPADPAPKFTTVETDDDVPF